MEIKRNVKPENEIIYIRNVDKETKRKFMVLCKQANLKPWELFKILVKNGKVIN